MPNLFRRSSPLIYAGTPLVVASTLLDALRPDMQLIVTSKPPEVGHLQAKGRFLAFGGYTVLKKLLETKPRDQYKVLFEPCERSSLSLGPIPPDAELSEVGPVEAQEVDLEKAIEEASHDYKPTSGGWCLLCDKGVATPWGLVMKPWATGRLRLPQELPQA